MIGRLFLFSFFMLGMILPSQAQLQKGSWMINGELRQENFSFPNAPPGSLNSFNLRLAPELSYMATNHLMLGGKLSIGLNGNIERRFGLVRQSLFVRHYFKQLDNLFLFYGGELAFNKNTLTEMGGGSRTFQTRSAYLQGGAHAFLQKSIALEFLFNYQMLFWQKSMRQTNATIEGGNLILEGRLQFFIHPRDKTKPSEVDYRFYPGNWLIGGNFRLGGNDFIQPEFQRFWGSGWTTGMRLEAAINLSNRTGALGFTPLIRKYFRLEKKGKPWLQVGGGIRGNYRRMRGQNFDEFWWTTTSRNLSLEGAIGWSNFISPNFTLDFFIVRKYLKSYSRNGSTEEQNIFSMGLIVSGLLK